MRYALLLLIILATAVVAQDYPAPPSVPSMGGDESELETAPPAQERTSPASIEAQQESEGQSSPTATSADSEVVYREDPQLRADYNQALVQLDTLEDEVDMLESRNGILEDDVNRAESELTTSFYLAVGAISLLMVSLLANAYMVLKNKSPSATPRSKQLAQYYYSAWKQQLSPILAQERINWQDYENALKGLLK